MKTSVVIPSYNHPKMTEECIDSVIENTVGKYDIILVDNGSVDRISDDYKKKVKYVRSEENILFGGACNLGAENSDGDVLCFLSNDVLTEKGWDTCSEFLLSDDSYGMVGPKLVYPNNTIQHAGVHILGFSNGFPIFEHRYRHLDPKDPRVNQVRAYQSITGACVFIRKSDFDEVEGFDTLYKNGYEDTDLCFKVRFNLNKMAVYYPEVTLIHKESVTTRDEVYEESLNRGIFNKKWVNVCKEDKPFWDQIDLEITKK